MCIEFHEIEIKIKRELNTRFGNWHRILILCLIIRIRQICWSYDTRMVWCDELFLAADVCICSLAVRWNCTAPMREMLKKKREKIDEATKFSYLDKASHWEEQDGQKKIAHSLRAYVNVSRKFAIDQTWFLGVINDTTAHTTRRAGLLLAPQPAANHRANRVMNKKNSLFAACYSIRNQFGSLLHLGKWERVEEKRVYHLFN